MSKTILKDSTIFIINVTSVMTHSQFSFLTQYDRPN